ncbi:MAG: type III-A CRISPR-associated RAMP protein Csm3 [Chloroherpetonaceae bacterium]
MKLTGKVFITGRIKLETGMRIGGSKSALDIGGIDLNVIKTATGVPYIPGSSLKGKLRAILAREEGSDDVQKDSLQIRQIFGSIEKDGATAEISRLIVRDAYLDVEHFKSQSFQDLELDYTETKWETAIDRKKGSAKSGSLRQLERVPAGAEFMFEIVYNVFDDDKKTAHITEIKKAMKILEDDYLGGQGSRGFGKVKFEKVVFSEKAIEDYKGTNQAKALTNMTW